MGITFLHKPAVEGEYTILSALTDFFNKKVHIGETLMLVNRATGEGYKVLFFDPVTGKARLLNNHGAELTPRISERESALYDAVWR